jgi:hypothetical protein
LLLPLLVQLSPTNARAQQPEPVDLAWTAPAECPRIEEVQAGIRKLAGPRKSSALSLRAEATVTRKEDGDLHLRLVLHAGEMVEERNISGRSCSALAGATAVAVALLFRSGTLQADDSHATTPVTSDTATTDKPKGEAGRSSDQAVPQPKAPNAAHSDAARRWHVLAPLPMGLFSVGPLRGPSLGIAVAAGASVDQWRFLARGSAWLPEHASATNNDARQYGADVRRSALTLSACRALTHSRLELAPCATFSLQHLSASGQGAHIAAHTARATWVAVGLGAQARLHLRSWLSLLLGAEAELQTSRPHLFVDGVGPVETLLPVAATLSAGPEWIF